MKEQEKQNLELIKKDFQDQILLITEEHQKQQNVLQEKLMLKQKKNNELREKMIEKHKGVSATCATDLKKLKMKMDKIIADLSQETNPNNLHHVAKDLLSLHRFIDMMNLNYDSREKKENLPSQPPPPQPQKSKGH